MECFEFKIEVISKKPEKIDGLLSYWGRITIGEFSERFVMPIVSWTLDEYVHQWKEGLERIKSYNTTCLVVTAQNLEENSGANALIETWTFYKEGETVFVHNNLFNTEIFKELNLSIRPSDYNIKNCYQLVDTYQRETSSDDGEQFFELKCRLSDIIAWLEHGKFLKDEENKENNIKAGKQEMMPTETIGRLLFTKESQWITPHTDVRGGRIWKKFAETSKDQIDRIGTLDKNGKEIKD